MKRLLLIDDERSELMFVNFLLKDIYKNDFNLGYASNIKEAISFLSKNRVDMILLDDKLGDGSTSSDNIPILNRKAFNVPVVIISKDINGTHLKDRTTLGTNKVVDKFNLQAALASGLLD